MRRRRLVVLGPAVGVLAIAAVLTFLGSSTTTTSTGGYAFTFEEDAEPTVPVVLRRRTITPEFDPPLGVRVGRVVYAQGQLACDPGEIYRVDVEITQGDAFARGRTVGRCTGEAQTWTAPAVAQGAEEFTDGPADACAVATTRRGGITDTHEWCATPTLTPLD